MVLSAEQEYYLVGLELLQAVESEAVACRQDLVVAFHYYVLWGQQILMGFL